MSATPSSAPVERVSQESMLSQFKDQLSKLLAENQQMSDKIKQNEIQALKLQGAIETLILQPTNTRNNVTSSRRGSR